MTVSDPLSDDLVELIAGRFRTLSEPTRIKLLDHLREGEASVLELTDLTGTTQQNVSKHLCVLQRAGIVARRKQGNFSVLPDHRPGRLRALRGSLRQPPGAGGLTSAPRPEERLMLELYQTEWCPASRRVRERLTELGLDYLIRQVPVEREKRSELLAAPAPTRSRRCCSRTALPSSARTRSSPISTRRFEEPPEAEAHRLKAAKARRRYLEEQCDAHHRHTLSATTSPPSPTPSTACEPS